MKYHEEIFQGQGREFSVSREEFKAERKERREKKEDK